MSGASIGDGSLGDAATGGKATGGKAVGGSSARAPSRRDRTLRAPSIGLRRALFFGLVGATTIGGGVLMLEIVRAAGVSPLELLILALFVPTFAWISIAFWNAVVGFTLGLLKRDPVSLGREVYGPGGETTEPLTPGADEAEPPLTTRTALVMPVYNEDPARTMAGLDATLRSLAATGQAHHFDVFLLSDSADPDVVAREERTWDELVAAWTDDGVMASLGRFGLDPYRPGRSGHDGDNGANGHPGPSGAHGAVGVDEDVVHEPASVRPAGPPTSADFRPPRPWTRPASFRYRRRAGRTGRKAGNLADFTKRWGDEVDFMVVLDADSVMSGPTLVELARTLEANPEAGLIQTVPVPAGQRTLFQRLVQFASALYSPMLAAGQAFWQGDAANYFGHNAILRVAAFREHARLPVLSGTPPLGGEVLSHDFVEAALLRRAGWGVWLLPGLGGSHEDVPGNVLDYAVRDRRWCQGSLQHLRLLFDPGLHALSRLHFALGAMGFVSSLLWLLMLLASTAYVGTEVGGLEGWLTRSTPLAEAWPLPELPAAVSLLVVTGVVLFLPKVLGTVLALLWRRRAFGGAARIVAGSVAEGVFAVVIAPVMMMYHARFVLGVLAGWTVRWMPQRRGGEGVSWRDALRGTAWMTALGALWSAGTWWMSPAFFLWLTPIFAGLWIAAPLVRWTSASGPGGWMRRTGLLEVPAAVAREDPSGVGGDRELAKGLWVRVAVAKETGANVGYSLESATPRAVRAPRPEHVARPPDPSTR